MPWFRAFKTIYLSALGTHAPFAFAFAFGTLYLRLAVWSWTPLFVLVHHNRNRLNLV